MVNGVHGKARQIAQVYVDLPQGRPTGNAMHQSPKMEEKPAQGMITQLSLVSNTVKVSWSFFL